MKNTFMVIPLVFLCCFAVGCQQGGEVAEEPVADVEADIQAIKDIVAGWDDAVNAADLDRIVPLYADDAVEIHPDDVVCVGKEGIQACWQEVFDTALFQEDFVTENVSVSCDLAVAHVIWSSANTIKATGELDDGGGSWIIVFKRQPDNAWKVIYSIFSDEDVIYPEQAEL